MRETFLSQYWQSTAIRNAFGAPSRRRSDRKENKRNSRRRAPGGKTECRSPSESHDKVAALVDYVWWDRRFRMSVAQADSLRRGAVFRDLESGIPPNNRSCQTLWTSKKHARCDRDSTELLQRMWSRLRALRWGLPFHRATVAGDYIF